VPATRGRRVVVSMNLTKRVTAALVPSREDVEFG
jgi:hypothetical protein